MSQGAFKVGIVGGGAVGLTYASLLSEDSDVTVVVRRDPQAAAINSNGIRFRRRDGAETVYRHVRSTTEIDALASCDAVIVAVKSYDTKAVATELSRVIQPNAVVLTLQNGLQAFPVLTSIVSRPERVFAGVTYVAAHRDDDYTITNGDDLRTVLDAGLGPLAALMSATALDVTVSPDSRPAVWDKMLLSTAQNGLSAITGLTFAEMHDSNDCLDIARSVLDEFMAVAEIEGISFDDDVMSRVRRNWKGSAFRPSMWQDLQRRQRTEIDAINGAVSELGRRHGIPTPANDMVTRLVKVLEAKVLGDIGTV